MFRNAVLALIVFLSVLTAAAAQPYFIDAGNDVWIRTVMNGSAQSFDVYEESGYGPDGDEVMWAYDDFEGAQLDRSKWCVYKRGSDNATVRVRGGDLILQGANSSSASIVVLNKSFDNGVEIAMDETLTGGTGAAGTYADVSLGSGEIVGGGREYTEWWHPSFEHGGSFRSQGINRSIYWKDAQSDLVPTPGISISEYSDGSRQTIAYRYDGEGRAYAHMIGVDQIRLPISAPDPYGYDQFVHADIISDSEGIMGHEYWLMATPFAWSDDSLENACLYCSDDGIAYEVPPGITNPIGAPTDPGNSSWGSDPDMVYNPRSGRMMLYYVIGDVIGDKTTETPKVRVYDGRYLSACKSLNFADSEGALFVSPSVLYDQKAGRFYMWVVDISQSYTNTICRFDSTDGINFGNKRTVAQSYWKKIWHMDVFVRPGDDRLYALMVYVGDDDLFIGTAEGKDGGFFVQGKPILKSSDASVSGHNNSQLYRSTGAFSDDGKTLSLWVSGKDVDGVRKIFYAQAQRRIADNCWIAGNISPPDAALMTAVNSSQQLNTSKRWMISQGDYTGNYGCKTVVHEIWAYRTGHDPLVSVKDMGAYKRVTITPVDEANVSDYQVRIPGNLLGIKARDASLRIRRV